MSMNAAVDTEQP